MSVDVTPNGTVGTKASEPEVRLSRIFSPAVIAAHRALGAIPGRGGPMLLLTTARAKSGTTRTNPVLYFVDE